MVLSERGFIWSLHDMVYGNEEKGRKPQKKFIDEMNKYPRLLEVAMGIEGIVNKRSEHASGVILYDQDKIFETSALMRTPSGSLVTQLDLHDAEDAGDIKYDFLVTEVTDKLITCFKLLENDSVVERADIRQLYRKYLHPDVIDTTNPQIWEHLAAGDILDVFQFNSGVGLAIAKKLKPSTPMEMTDANAINNIVAIHFTAYQQGNI